MDNNFNNNNNLNNNNNVTNNDNIDNNINNYNAGTNNSNNNYGNNNVNNFNANNGNSFNNFQMGVQPGVPNGYNQAFNRPYNNFDRYNGTANFNQGNNFGQNNFQQNNFQQAGPGYQGNPNMNNYYNRPSNNFDDPTKYPKNKKLGSFEDLIGKSFMGIIASVFIFIGMILFAIAVAPYVTDVLKCLALYVVSFIFIIYGVIKLRKDKNNFFMSLTACGVGMLYISMMLTYFHYGFINEIALMVLLLVWSVSILYLSRYGTRIFIIIGRLGIAISIIAAQSLSGENLLMSVIFAATAMLVYVVFDIISSYDNSAINNAFNILNIFLLYIALVSSGMSWYDRNVLMIVLSLIAVFLLFISLIIYRKKAYYSEDFLVSGALYAIAFAFMLHMISYRGFDMDKDMLNAIISSVEIIVMLIYVLTLGAVKKNALEVGFPGVNFIENAKFAPIIIIALNTLNYAILSEYIGLAIIAIPLIIVGFFKNSRVYRNIGLVLLYMYSLNLFSNSEVSAIVITVVGYVLIIMTAILMHIYKACYSRSFKISLYILFLIHSFLRIGVITDLVFDVDAIVSFTLATTTVVIIHYIVSFIPAFCKDLVSGLYEPQTATSLRVINLIIMAVCLINIGSSDELALTIWASIVGICAFSRNTVNLFKNTNPYLSSIDIYICIKFFILDRVILYAFGAPAIVNTVSWILLAVIYISIGIIARRHQFRTVGLILTMVSIFKLLMFDVHVSSLYLRALGFIVSGVLCFIISLIYNNIDKKLGGEQ